MYYIVCEEGIRQVDRTYWENHTNSIAVFAEEEWQEELDIQEKFSLGADQRNVFFCKMEQYPSYLFGTFRIPVKKKEKRYQTFLVYILKDRLIFIDNNSLAEETVEKIAEKIRKKNYSLALFLSDFFMLLLEKDILYLASLEREIADMEELVLEGNTDHFNYQMLNIKKEISRLYCYYSQMADAGEVLCEEWKDCQLYLERVRRLWQESLTLREYAMQVQDVYQSEIAIRQNDIMKILTVVTTIFLPLSLIAGWYGMNFYNMPELSWKYSYPVIAGISILVVIISLWLFKKKKFF